jgi:hypothetical protein
MIIILQTIIALVAIIALFSIVNSLLLDGLRRFLNTRADELFNSLQDLFEDKAEQGSTLIQEFYEHEFIEKLNKAAGKKRPSWIDSGVFAEVCIQLLSKRGGLSEEQKADPEAIIAAFEGGIKNVPKKMQPALNQLLAYAKERGSNQLSSLRNKIIHWFDDYMKTITEKFKRKTRVVLFGTGLILAVACNVDMIHITRELAKNETLRLEYYHAGKKMGEGDVKVNEEKIIEYLGKNMDELNANDLVSFLSENITTGQDSTAIVLSKGKSELPMGWPMTEIYIEDDKISYSRLGLKFLGILFMAGAMAFGAPFWFDLLKKLTISQKLL